MHKVYCTTLHTFVEVDYSEFYDLMNGIIPYISVQIGNQTFNFKSKDFN
jgi:hypothetical protein